MPPPPPPAAQVPPTVDPIELSRNMLESYGTAFADFAPHLAQLAALTLTDTPPSTSPEEVAATVASAQPDVAVLCCSCEDPASFERLAEFWLPALGDGRVRRPAGWPFLPVVLAWTKHELLDAAPREQWERAARRVHALCAPEAPLPADAELAAEPFGELVGRIMDWLATRFPHFQSHSYLSAAHPEEGGSSVSEIAIVWEAVSRVWEAVAGGGGGVGWGGVGWMDGWMDGGRRRMGARRPTGRPAATGRPVWRQVQRRGALRTRTWNHARTATPPLLPR